MPDISDTQKQVLNTALSQVQERLGQTSVDEAEVIRGLRAALATFAGSAELRRPGQTCDSFC